ncbi:meiosis-specific protein MEI4 [Gadus macrocephalus]|uniref:meiosis-specific protein MEI4 n=1 Tax=Gadus macrocephalus TaxID=80720 RepID=UPI0028CB987F|nr:meiosis-specific protein MEI4 [Gadus macrocephalus]
MDLTPDPTTYQTLDPTQGPAQLPRDGGAGGGAAWLVRKARLAVALAVIKSRPPGLSGRQQAEALASKMRSRDAGLRSRGQELQEEVLRLRQQLLLAKMAARRRDVGGASGEDGYLPQDLGVPAEEEASMVDSDSESLLPHVDPVHPVASGGPHTDPVPPAVPVNPQTFSSAPPRRFPPPQTASPRGGSMQGHMRFLQSLCGLRRAADRGGGGGPAWSGPQQEDSAVMAESLSQLLGSVVVAAAAACPADPPALPSGALVLEACRVLAGAADAGGLNRQPSFVTEVEGSLKELAGLLLSADRLGKGAVSGDHLTEVLVLLGASRLLRPLLVRRLLSLLRGLAERLCHLCQVEEHLEPEDEVLHLHENSFHLFWLLERLLQPGVEGAPQDYQGAGAPQDYQGPQDCGGAGAPQDYQGAGAPQDYQGAGAPQDYQGAGAPQDQGPQDCGGAGAPQDYQGAGVPQEQGPQECLGAGVPQDRGAFQGPQGGTELQGLQGGTELQGLQGGTELQGPQGGTELQGPQEREAFLGLLGHSVLLLSDEFPLFALYMWRIGALLSWS